MPCKGGGEDSAKCLTKGLGKNKGSDGSLHNLSEKGGKTESSVFGAGNMPSPDNPSHQSPGELLAGSRSQGNHVPVLLSVPAK